MSFVLKLFILQFSFIQSSIGTDTLQLVNLLYRHGDRTPMGSIPSDNATVDWPQGYGQLTKVGMFQEFQLGEYIRKRYNGFLNSTYVREQIYVRSTDLDRALMSAQSVLSGLYKPEGDQKWSEQILWQPIPVHTQPCEDDQLMSHAPCDRLVQRNSEVLQKPEVFNHIRTNYEEFLTDVHHNLGLNWSMVREERPYDYVYKLTDNFFIKAFLLKFYTSAGYPWSPINETLAKFNFTGVFTATNTLSVKNIYHKPLPTWATNETVAKITELRNYLWYVQANDTLTVKLRSGALLNKMVTDMRLKAAGFQLKGMKMFMYSGHDSNVLPLLSALKVNANNSCPYSTMVMLELHKSADNKYFVQVWLRNDTAKDPYLLTVPGCQQNCSLELFVNLTSSMLVRDRYRECIVYTIFGFTSFKNTVLFFALVGSALFFFVALMIAVICHKCCCKKRVIKYRIHENTELPETLPMMTSHGSLSDDD